MARKEPPRKVPCNELTCNKLKNCNIHYRLYDPLGGPHQEGWSLISDVYVEKDKSIFTCYEAVKYCPFCQKKLDKRPTKVRPHRK